MIQQKKIYAHLALNNNYSRIIIVQIVLGISQESCLVQGQGGDKSVSTISSIFDML